MTAYFDQLDREVSALRVDLDPHSEMEMLRLDKIEDRLGFDVLVATEVDAGLASISEESSAEIRRAILRSGVRSLPLGAERDYPDIETRRALLLRLSSDLHDAFHRVARGGGVSDDPSAFVRVLFARAEERLEEEATERGPRRDRVSVLVEVPFGRDEEIVALAEGLFEDESR